ncbi:MAG: type II CRISPR-associated endonuclease Cas1 [Scrofimicrobium sp.]
MDAWRVIDCSSMKGELSGSHGTLKIMPEGQPSVSVPLAEIAVLLVGLETKLSSGLLVRLMNSDTTVVPCDWAGVAVGGLIPWSTHTRIGARQEAQANVSLPRKKALWGQIVRGKILGQAMVLEAEDKSAYKTLRRIANDVRSGDPANSEGQAARVYWKALFDDDFSRVPGGGGEINWALDYGYTVLRGLGIRGVASAGLIPSLGVFHRGRSNPFNLVDDLMEVYRPMIDFCVATELQQAEPGDKIAKQRLVALFSQPFEDSGVGVAASFSRFSQFVGQYFEGDITRVDVPSWRGPEVG